MKINFKITLDHAQSAVLACIQIAEQFIFEIDNLKT